MVFVPIHTIFGVDYMPLGSNRIIRFCGWWLEFFHTKFYMIPHTWAKGELIFFGQLILPFELLYKFVVRISI